MNNTRLFVFFVTLFISVSVFSQKVQVVLDTTFTMRIISDTEAVYINNYTLPTYNSLFINELRDALNREEIQLELSDNQSGAFHLNIAGFYLKEYIETETVDDTASEEYGQQYDLSYCEIKVEFLLSDAAHHTINSWKIEVLKQEEVSNSRSFFDWLLGINKDHTRYHEKKLDSDVFLREIKIVSAKMSRKISRKIRKDK